MIGVVGGSGFIGSQLCARFAARGEDFVIIDKNPSHFFPQQVRIADVRIGEDLTEALRGCSLIYNLAAEHRDDVRPVSLYDDVNVQGARNLCEALDRLRIRKLVFTSSVAVYGSAPPNTDETGAVRPCNDYGRTKREAELVYQQWKQASGEAMLAIIRPTVVFGPRNRGNIYNLLRQIGSGHFVMVGSGRNIKSMAYVENVAAFLDYAADFSTGTHLYNYVDKPDMDMNALVTRVRGRLGMGDRIGMRLPVAVGYLGGRLFDAARAVTGHEFSISALRVRKFCATTQFTSSRRDQTGFTAPFSLEEGLDKTLDYEFRGGAARGPDADVVFATE
jgi:GlcNAc-P-P-Und epimerase